MEKNNVVDWQKDPELLQLEAKLAEERAKRQVAADRLPEAEARARELEDQAAQARALESVGRKDRKAVDAAEAAVAAQRAAVDRFRGEAAVAQENAQALEVGLQTVRRDAVRRADAAVRERTAQLVAQLKAALEPVAALNDELDAVFAAARHTLPANGPEGEIVKSSGVPICSGFAQSLAFQRPPTRRTVDAWSAMADDALSHAARVAKRCRGEA